MRLRLRSPAREQFGNFVGQSFSDVGLEADMDWTDTFASMSTQAVMDASEPSP